MKQTNGANTAPAAETEQALNMAELMRAMHGHLQALNSPKPTRRLVDVFDSEASVQAITLRYTRSALCLVDRVIYSIGAAATLTIGKRSIPLTGPAVASIAFHELALNFNDNVTLALTGGPGALYLELIGWQVSPAERLEVIN
jgi:hypothetical protein